MNVLKFKIERKIIMSLSMRFLLVFIAASYIHTGIYAVCEFTWDEYKERFREHKSFFGWIIYALATIYGLPVLLAALVKTAIIKYFAVNETKNIIDL